MHYLIFATFSALLATYIPICIGSNILRKKIEQDPSCPIISDDVPTLSSWLSSKIFSRKKNEKRDYVVRNGILVFVSIRFAEILILLMILQIILFMS